MDIESYRKKLAGAIAGLLAIMAGALGIGLVSSEVSASLAPTATPDDVGECAEIGPPIISYETEPVDSPFVPTPPPTEWSATIVFTCQTASERVNETSVVRRPVYDTFTWVITDETDPAVLDGLREVLGVEEPDDGRIDIDG